MTKQKTTKTIYIKGDRISRRELVRRLNQDRVNHAKFELEKIRINDSMDNLEKEAKRSAWEWRLTEFRREMER